MSYLDEFVGRSRPLASSPLIGSPLADAAFLEGAAFSYRSNQFRPSSPLVTTQNPKPTNEPALLKRQKVDFTPDEPIIHLVAGNSQVAIFTKEKKLLFIDTTNGEQLDCDLARHFGNRLLQARLYKIFLDPTGRFTLISLAFATDNQPMDNLLYVKRLLPLPRLKGHLISAVAWNFPRNHDDDVNPNSTGTILLGTKRGLILQAEFTHSDETKFFPLTTGPRQYVKEIYDLGPDVGAITGIEYHQIPSSSISEKYFIIFVTTNSRLYRMVGSVPADLNPPPLHLIIAQNVTSYKDAPGRLNASKLDFHYKSQNSPPVRYGWLTEQGVMTGQIHNIFAEDKMNFDSSKEVQSISYDGTKFEANRSLPINTPSALSPALASMTALYHDKPISLVVANFHVVVLFRLCIKAICILNNAIVYEEYFNSKRYGNVQGMCKEPIKGTIWVYFERAILRYKLSNENRNVWRIYLDQGNFELAKKYSANHEANYDRVICEEARHYFKLQEYEKSAEIFAKSKKPFEDVSLMFMDIKSNKGLRKFLSIRLEQLDPTQNQSIQQTMTLAWLMEIIISTISVARTQPSPNVEELDELTAELEQIYKSPQNVDCLRRHKSLFYGIMRNHAELEIYVRFAKLIEDFEQVIGYYMDIGELGQALELMKVLKNDEMFYKYGHILMKRMPKELVDALMEQPCLNPSKLVPVLIQENPYYNKCAETIRYLEFCINELKVDSRLIHNYLFELYARHRDEDKLIEYLEAQLAASSLSASNSLPLASTSLSLDLLGSPTEPESSPLNLQLCLRLCNDLKLQRACVCLYFAMGLHDEALDLALTFDQSLAKSIATRAPGEDLQKRLWLTIAQKVLSSNLDIEVATSFLKESKLLKIEDVLPFFPDYKTIDFFKSAIRQSLSDYQEQITNLKDGTFEKIASEVRAEIKAFRGRYSVIKLAQKCELCHESLCTRAYFVFPCGHLFHGECIVRELLSVDPDYKQLGERLKRLAQTQSQSAQHAQNVGGAQSSAQFALLSASYSASARLQRDQQLLASGSLQSQAAKSAGHSDQMERLELELEQLVSTECPFCGSLLVAYMDKMPALKLDLDIEGSGAWGR